MKYFVLYLLLNFGTICQAQEIDLISLESLNEMIEARDKKLKVFNFWASWCRPCIQEMPYFESINQEEAEVYFISVDHPEDLEKAERMIVKYQIKSRAFLLDESDADKFITSINEDWTGAIPATLFVDAKGNKYFYEQAFDKPELDKFVTKYSSSNN